MSKRKRVYLSPSDQRRNTYAYGNTNEAEQCGRIAEECRKALVRNGVEVMVGQYDTMANRCAASDRFGADLHVPIHTNAYNGKTSGTRIFCYSMDGAGYKACKAVFDVLAPYTPGTSESIKANPSLYEVKNPKAPTVYIEVDFHDVPDVAKWIIENTNGIGEKIAEGLCNALGVAYVKPEAEESTDTIYRVQVGAFKVRKNAENMLADLKKAGFDGYIRED